MSTDTCIRGVKAEIPKHPNICSLLIKITFCGLSSIVSRPMSCDGRNRAFLVQEKTSVWWSSSNHMERQSHKPERVVRESPCYGPQQRPKRQSSLALLVPGNGLVCNICSSKEKTEYREGNRSNMISKVLIQHICPYKEIYWVTPWSINRVYLLSLLALDTVLFLTPYLLMPSRLYA